MKTLHLILAAILLGLSFQPCLDEIGESIEMSQTEKHSHSEDKMDDCSMICACSCCGISIVSQSFSSQTEITTAHLSVSRRTFFYSASYRFDFKTHIWQPPKLV